MKTLIITILFIITSVLISNAQNQELNFSFGHTKPITTIAISNNGSFVLSSAIDKTIKLWDIKTGKNIYTFYGIKSNVSKLLFNSSDTKFFAGLITGEVIFFDIESKKIISTFNPDMLKDVKVLEVSSKDEKIIAGYDGIIKLWDIKSKTLEFQLNNLEAEVLSVKFVPKMIHKFIYSLNELSSVKLVSLDSVKNNIKILKDISQIINDIEFVDKDRVLLADNSGKTTFYSISNNEVISIYTDIYETAINVLAVSKDKKYFATGSVENEMRIWDIDSVKTVRSQEGKSMKIIDLEFVTDDSEIVFTQSYGIINIWNIKQIHKFRLIRTSGVAKEITSLSCANDLLYITASYDDNRMRIWNTKTLEFNIVENFEGNISSIQFSTSNKKLLISTNESIYDENTFETTDLTRLYKYDILSDSTKLLVKNKSIFDSYFTNNDSVVIVLLNGEIKKFNIFTEFKIDSQKPSDFKIISSAISNDKTNIVTATNNTISFFEILTNNITSINIDEQVMKLLFSKNDKFLYVFTDYANIKVYETKTLKLIKQVKTNINNFSYVNFISENEILIYDKLKSQKYLFNINDFSTTETSNYDKFIIFERKTDFLITANKDGIIDVFDSQNVLNASIMSLSKKEWIIINPQSYFSASNRAVSLITQINMPKPNRTIESYRKENVLSEIFD